MYFHGYYSTATYNQLLANCNGNYWSPSPACSVWIQQMLNEIGEVNMYDIYDPCPETSYKMPTSKQYSEWMPFSSLSPQGATSCIDPTEATAYLNVIIF